MHACLESQHQQDGRCMHNTQYAWSDRMLAEAVLTMLHAALRLSMSTCMPVSCLYIN